mgnify:CR=1 FL=1
MHTATRAGGLDAEGREALLRYVLRRLLVAIPTLFVIVSISFFLMRVAPGGPFNQERGLNPTVLANLNRLYRLDQPLWVQYLDYLKGLARGDLGPSYTLPDFTVVELFAKGLPISIELGASAEDISILGDPVEATGEGAVSQRGQRRMERPRLDFDSMNAPFELGHGYLVIKDADVRGQVLGVLLKGRVDFRSQRLDLGGTYVPLQGLNSAIGNFPILGQILAGPRGEGVIGMTFGITGAMSRPLVTVNPVSIVPGIFRDIFQMTNPNPRITPRDNQPAPAGQKATSSKGSAVKSSAPPAAGKAGANKGPARPARIDADGDWSSQPPPD